MATQEKILTLIANHLQTEEQILTHNEKPIMVEGRLIDQLVYLKAHLLANMWGESKKSFITLVSS